MRTVLLSRYKPEVGLTLQGYRFNNGNFEYVTISTVTAVKYQPELNCWLVVTTSGSNYFVVVNLP